MQGTKDTFGLNDRLELCSPEMRAIYTEIYRAIAREQRQEDAE